MKTLVVATRLVWLMLLLALGATNAFAQTTYTWASTNSGGSWATATNWSPTRTTPATNDVLVFNTSADVTITNIPTQTIGRLRNTGTGTVILQPQTGANRILTIQAGGTVPQLDMTGGSFTINGLGASNTLILAVASGNTVETAGGSSGTRLTVTNFSQYTNNGNTFTLNGASWDFQNGSIYQHAVNQGTIPVSTWGATSVAFISGVTNGNGSGFANITNINQSFGVFRWNCTQSSHLTLGVNSGFSTQTLEVQRTNGTFSGAQYNGNGSRFVLSLVNSVASGSVTLNMGNITMTNASGSQDALLVLNDAPASGGNTVTINISGTVTLGGSSDSRLIMVGNNAPTTVNATGTTAWAANGNGRLIYLDPGGRSNCSVTVTQMAGVNLANSSAATFWPYRGYSLTGTTGGSNNTLTATMGSSTQAASINIAGLNAQFIVMAQNANSATNQTNNTVNMTVYGNITAVATGSLAVGLNMSDRSDVINQVANLTVRKTTAGNDGNVDINGTFNLSANATTLASNGNRAQLNIEGNLVRGSYNAQTGRANMVSRIRMFGAGSQIGTTATPTFTNALDLDIDCGTGNSVSLANNLTLSSVGYLHLTSGQFNLNSRTLNIPANHWINLYAGTLSATPTYTDPYNLYYRSGTRTTGFEISSGESGFIVIGDGVSLTANTNLRFRTVFCNKGTFTQNSGSAVFYTGRGGTSEVTDSADASYSTTFNNFSIVNQLNNSVLVWNTNATVNGNFSASVVGGSVTLSWARGNSVTSKTLDVLGNFSLGTTTFIDMTAAGPTLTANGPDHALNVGGTFVVNNGNSPCRFVYPNSGFAQAVNVTVGGDFSSSITSAGNMEFKNLNFTKNGVVTIGLLEAAFYGNIGNTPSTTINISGGRQTFRGGLQGFAQTIGSTGGGPIALFNVSLDIASTSVTQLQDISINGTSNTNNAFNACAFGINNLTPRPVYSTGTFKLTFSSTASNGVFFMPDVSCFNGTNGEVVFNVAAGNTTQILNNVTFGKLTTNSLGGTVSTSNSCTTVNITGDATIDGPFTHGNTSSVLYFAAAGSQNLSGSGIMLAQGIQINAGATVNSTLFRLQYNGTFSNQGTFTATAGEVRTYGGTLLQDIRTGVNTTFFNLYFTGNTGTPQLWDMDCVVNGTWTITSDGSGFVTRLPITGGGRTISVNNIYLFQGNNSWGIDQSSGGRTLTQNTTHTIIVRGNIVQEPISAGYFFRTHYANSGFISTTNVVANPTGGDKTWFFITPTGSGITANNLTLDPTATNSVSINTNMFLLGNVQNTSAQNMTFTGGRIIFGGTPSAITQSGSGSLTLFNMSIFSGRTVNLSGTIRCAGTGTGTGNEQAAIDLQSTSTLNFGSSTFEFISGAAHMTFNGTATFGTSTLIFKNTANPRINTAANLTFNNVTLDFQGGSVLEVERSNRTYTFNGLVDTKNYQIVAFTNSGGSTFSLANGSEFRTSNLNGFSGTTSSALSSTNSPTITLGTTSKVVYYAPSGNQVVSSRVYGNVDVIGGGTKTLAGNITMAGGNTLFIQNGNTLNTGTFQILRSGGTGNLVVNLDGILQTGIAAGFNAATGTLAVTDVAINFGSGALVEYNGSVAQTVTALPSVSTGIYPNLTLSNSAGLSLAANTTVASTLTLSGGALTLGNNNLTLGTSVSSVGSLVVNSGLLATTGTGSFIRWVGTSGLPTSVNSGIRFPVGTTSSDRSLNVAFSSAAALSAGGTISVRHNLANGVTNVASPFLDGAGGDQITISERTNASWIITTPDVPTLAGGESISIQAFGTNITAVPSISTARLVTDPGPAAGTSVSGTGTITSPIIGREALSLANLAQTWYLGSSDIQAVVVAVNGTAANWGTPGTWSTGAVPLATDYVVIPSSAAAVSLAGAASYPFLTLQVDQGAVLNALSATLQPAAGGSINFFGTVLTTNPNGFSGTTNTTVSSANSPSISFGSTGTCNYNATAAQTITPGQYTNLTVSGNKGAQNTTWSGTIMVSNQLSYTATNTTNVVTGSTVEFNGSGTQTIPALTFYNNIASSGSGARIINGSVGLAGSFAPGTNPYTVTGSTITYNSSGAQTIAAFNYDVLASTGTGARTLSSTGIIGVAGGFFPGTNAYTVAGSTIDYNGTGTQTVAVFNYHNLIVSGGRGSNTVSMGTGTVSVAGALTLAPSNTYSFVSNTFVYNGTGAVSQTIVGGSFFNYSNLTINTSLTGSATVILDPVNPIRIANTFAPTATPGGAGYVNTNSRIVLLSGGTQTIPAFVYFTLETINSSVNYATPSSGVIEIQNQWIGPVGGVNTLTGTGSTVRFTASGNQNLPNVTNFWNVEFTGTGVKTAAGNMIARNSLTLDNTYISFGAGQRLQIGESATQVGTLNITGAAGVINSQTSNSAQMSIRRYFGTSGLPTTFGNAGLFPVVRNYLGVLSSRYVWLSFSSATALTTGGFVDLTFANGSGVAQDGLAAFTAFSDATGSPTLNIARAAGYKWIFAQTGMVLGAGQSVNLMGENEGSMTVSTVSNTRLINFNTSTTTHLVAPGTSTAGTGTTTYQQGTKTGLTLAQLTAANMAWAVATDKVLVQSLASGNFSNAALWAGGLVPGSADDIEIRAPHTVALTTNQTVNSIVIRNGATLQTNNFTITLGASQNMNVEGTLRLANPILQGTGAALATTNSPTLTLAPTSTVVYESTASQTVGNVTYNNLVFNGSANITINGTVTVQGSFTNTGTNNFTNTGTIVFDGTGSVTVPNINYHNLTVQGARGNNTVTFPSTVSLTGTFNPASTFTGGGWNVTGTTFDYTGSAAQTVAPFTYNNLTLSGSRGGNSITLSGDYTIRGVFSPSATFTTGGGYNATASTLTFDNTTAQTIPSFNYGSLTVQGARGANNITFSGTTGVAGVFSPIASFTTGNYVTTGNTIDYNGTGAQVITPWLLYNNLQIQGSRGANNVTLISGTVRVANSMFNFATFSTGQIVANTGSLVELSHPTSVQMPQNMTFDNLTITNNANVVWRMGTTRIGGTFAAGSGTYSNNDPNTVLFTGVDGQVIPAIRYYNLSSTNNTRVLAAGTLLLEGDLTAGTGFYVAPSTILSISGAAQNISGINGTLAGLTFGGYSIKTLSGGITVASGGTVTVGGCTVANASNITLGDLGTVVINNAAASIGALTLSNTANFTYNTAYTTGSELPNNSTAVRNLTVNPGSGQVVALGNNVTVNNTLNLSTGRLSIAGRTVRFNGTTTGTGQISADNNTNLTIGGTVGGNFGTLNFGPTNTDRVIGTLSIRRNGGVASVSLGSNLTVTSAIMFDVTSTATVNTGANTLTLGASGTITGEANGRYVVGNLYTERTQNNGNNNYGGIGVVINNCTNCNMGLVTVLRKTGSGTSITGASGNRSIDRTWDIEPQTQPASAVVLGLSWLSADDFYSSPGIQSRVWRSTDNGTTWTRMGLAGTFTNRSIWVVTDHFSDWTVADENNPLPLDFLSINAKRNGAGVEVSWTTINEVNTDRFEVERSADGASFNKLGSVAASGNTREAVKYHYLDALAPKGATLYYRIKQYDQDGKFEYSPVVALSADENSEPSLHPNPATGTVLLNMPASTIGDYSITMTDAVGKVVRTQKLSQLSGASVNTISLEALPAGLYQVTVTQTTSGSTWNTRLTVR